MKTLVFRHPPADFHGAPCPACTGCTGKGLALTSPQILLSSLPPLPLGGSLEATSKVCRSLWKDPLRASMGFDSLSNSPSHPDLSPWQQGADQGRPVTSQRAGRRVRCFHARHAGAGIRFCAAAVPEQKMSCYSSRGMRSSLALHQLG